MYNENIIQTVPAGAYSAEEQVGFTIAAIRKAADYLEFQAIDELETALAQMREALVLQAAAGLLGEISFYLQDDQGVCGVQVTISPYEVADYEEADLSRLRLLANPEACGSIEVGCIDGAFALEISGAHWLPAPSEVLSCSLVSWADDQIEH